MIGMLWFDNDEQRDLAAKVGRAAEYYREKYGKSPNLCFVHLSQAPKEGRVDGIEVRGTRAVMSNHFWVGVEQEPAKASSPSAQGVVAQGVVAQGVVAHEN